MAHKRCSPSCPDVHRPLPGSPLGSSPREGDYVKAEFPDEPTGESKRMRAEAGILVGKLDSVPLLVTDPCLGDELVVSCDKAVEHSKASGFEKQ